MGSCKQRRAKLANGVGAGAVGRAGSVQVAGRQDWQGEQLRTLAGGRRLGSERSALPARPSWLDKRRPAGSAAGCEDARSASVQVCSRCASRRPARSRQGCELPGSAADFALPHPRSFARARAQQQQHAAARRRGPGRFPFALRFPFAVSSPCPSRNPGGTLASRRPLEPSSHTQGISLGARQPSTSQLSPRTRTIRAPAEVQ